MLSVYSISKLTCHILVTDGDGHAIRTIMVKKPYFSCHIFSEQKCEGNNEGMLAGKWVTWADAGICSPCCNVALPM